MKKPRDSDAGQQWAVFDLDGVFLKGDTFTALALSQFRKDPRRLGYIFRHFSQLGFGDEGSRIRLFATASIRGMDKAEYQHAAKTIALYLANEKMVFPEAIATVNHHLELGQKVMVATASEYYLADAFLKEIGIADKVTLSASSLSLPQGIFSPHNRGTTKAENISRIIGTDHWSISYSDSLSDLPMLQRAEQAILVNAKPKKDQRARNILGDQLKTVKWDTLQ